MRIHSEDPVFLCTEEIANNPDNSRLKLIAGKWYFWIETWADTMGPYDSEKEANEALNKYAENL